MIFLRKTKYSFKIIKGLEVGYKGQFFTYLGSFLHVLIYFSWVCEHDIKN